MFSIKTITKSELIIKNSRFITILVPINEETNTNKILDQIKEEYKKANHYCFAYITKSSKKSSDDKEPSSTAGLPMLNVLEKNEMINIMAITVRYFGGIKLGAGGLVRAYSKSVSNALSNTILVEIEQALKVQITASYNEIKNLDYLLKDCKIIKKDFNDTIVYTTIIPKRLEDKLKNYNYKIIDNNTFIKK